MGLIISIMSFFCDKMGYTIMKKSIIDDCQSFFDIEESDTLDDWTEKVKMMKIRKENFEKLNSNVDEEINFNPDIAFTPDDFRIVTKTQKMDYDQFKSTHDKILKNTDVKYSLIPGCITDIGLIKKENFDDLVEKKKFDSMKSKYDTRDEEYRGLQSKYDRKLKDKTDQIDSLTGIIAKKKDKAESNGKLIHELQNKISNLKKEITEKNCEIEEIKLTNRVKV